MEQVELWDLYDRDRKPLGKTIRRDIDPFPLGTYHIVIHICIFNSQNQLLIQQRQPWKTYGNMWDVTVGGSALTGETSAMAAERELKEEIGYALDFSAIRPVCTFHFLYGFDDFYVIKQDVDLDTLTLQPEEVAAVRWATKEEVVALQKEGKFIPHWAVEQLFDHRCWSGSVLEDKQN